MSSTLVERKAVIEKLRLAWRDPSIRLIHIYGIAGSGKTTIARQLFSDDDSPILEFQCRLEMGLDLRSFMGRLERTLLTPKQIRTLQKRTQEALIAFGY